MKKIILILILIGAFGFGHAQNSKVVSAYNYAKPNYKQYDKAKTAIDEAVEHEKTSQDPKAWFYRGRIYQQIYQDSTFHHLCENPLKVVVESFEKSLEYDAKNKFKKEVVNLYNIALQQIRNEAINALKAKEYQKSYEMFDLLIKGTANENTMALNEVYDGAAFYAGYTAEETGNIEKAHAFYDQSIAEGKEMSRAHIRKGLLYLNANDSAAYLAIMQKGIETVEDNKDILLLLIDYYNKAKKMDEALTYINKAIEKDPQNVKLYQAQGDILSAMDKPEEALKSYNKAMEIAPDDIDVMFNTGTLFFNRAAEYKNKTNELALDQEKEYKELMDNAVKEFKQAAKYFERAHELAPDDKQITETLKKIYMNIRTEEGIQEKLDKVNKLLQE